MGNIIDELLTDEEKEQMEADTIKEQDLAIMKLSNEKKKYQNLVDSINVVLKDEERISQSGNPHLLVSMEHIKNVFLNRIEDIEKHITQI